MLYYDAIVIHFSDDDGSAHNIIVDGGEINSPKYCYTDRLKKELEAIFSKGESIDLWVVSHIDNDHIGGIHNFIDDKDFFESHHENLKEVWMNYGGDDDYIVQRTGKIGFNSGKKLRDVLLEKEICVKKGIVARHTKSIKNAVITVVAPDNDAYTRYIEWWNDHEFVDKVETSDGLISGRDWDYAVKFRDFDLSRYNEDNEVKNNSSIAFVLSYHDNQILFSADSCSTILMKGLEAADLVKEGRVKLNLVHIPHHGSSRNSSFDFFKSIDCQQYIVTGNGDNKYKLPDKETIARLIAANPSGVNLHFTEWNSILQEIFSEEEECNLELSNEVKFVFE